MTELADVDYFTNAEVAQYPYEYWDHLRERGPVFAEPHYGVVAVTGYQEVMAAFKDHATFSAVNAIGGPFPPLPFTPEGDDISEQIEAHRHLFPIHEHMVVSGPTGSGATSPPAAARCSASKTSSSATCRSSTPRSSPRYSGEGSVSSSTRAMVAIRSSGG